MEIKNMKYEVFISSNLNHYISGEILLSPHGEYFSKKLAKFDEIHIIEFTPDGLYRLGVGEKVVLDLKWVGDVDNPKREQRLKCLIGYLDQYSSVYHEALRVYSNMEASGIELNRGFFEYYANLLSVLARKMQSC
jgi:hypothetical protein